MAKLNKDYTIILFYKYTKIGDPEALVAWHKKIGEGLNLKGRVIVAKEGINATLEGKNADIEKYSKALREIGTAKNDAIIIRERSEHLHRPFGDATQFSKDMGDFTDVQIKTSVGTGSAFPKLRVRLRNEIVSLGLKEEDFDPNEITGVHLKPEELKKWYQNKKDFVVVDMRNDFEYEVGRFENSINPPIEYFRDLPKALPHLSHLKEKTVVTVCTGGVRCEKASGYLMKKGFKDVYQLDGGMHKYMEKFPGEDFLGTLYTFDNRVVMDFGGKGGDAREVIGKCKECESTCETFSHCGQSECHKHLIVCKDCLDKHGRIFCGFKCKIRHWFNMALGRRVLPVKIEN